MILNSGAQFTGFLIYLWFFFDQKSLWIYNVITSPYKLVKIARIVYRELRLSLYTNEYQIICQKLGT